MDYIVFDLEWNQCPDGKKKEDASLPFEIIEIGAWKLNEQREIVDFFHRLVRPQVYQDIHFRTQEVIHMDMKILKGGMPFPAAAREFLEWCGKDCRYCTWGDVDLAEFQRNLKYYHLENLLPGPIFYLDAQKLFSLNYEDGKIRKSLEHGIDYMGLPKEEKFHRALEDAKYTALIFQKLDETIVETYYSVDTYQSPAKRKDEIYLSYPGYDKFISKEFPDKEAAMRDRVVCSTRCICCHKPAKRKIRWFCANSQRYFSVSYCQEHGYIQGKIKIRKNDRGCYYVVKTLKFIDEGKVQSIRDKQIAIRRKRWLKRHREND